LKEKDPEKAYEAQAQYNQWIAKNVDYIVMNDYQDKKDSLVAMEIVRNPQKKMIEVALPPED